MANIFKNKPFHQWACKNKLKDAVLIKAVEEIEKGLYAAKLSGFLYKKRLPKDGKGKRGGVRTLLAYKANDKVVFLYGFLKNERENINLKEKQSLKKLAEIYFSYNAEQIKKAVHVGELIEVLP